MKKILTLIPFIASAAFAQVDSLKHSADSVKTSVEIKLDSVKTSVGLKLDSIEGSFTKQVDSLKGSYAKSKNRIESSKTKYQHKIDSLNNLRLPTEKYTGKVDSLNIELAQVQQKVAARIDSLKVELTSKIKSLDLPPEVNGKVAALTSSLDKINLPTFDADISGKLGLDNINGALPNLPTSGINASLPAANLPNSNIPGVSVPTLNTPDPGVQENLGRVNDITGKAGDFQQQVKEVASVEGAGKVIENKVSELDPVKGIQGQIGLPMQAPATDEEAKEQLKDMVKEEAVNHFEGKEAALQKAMDKMSNYKQKYSSVQSLKDLPKKAPNPMKNKPFIERIVPGVAFQIFMRDNFLLDVAPYVGYKFSGRLTIGAGWNQRASFNYERPASQMKVYGPRLYGEYKVFKKISGRLELETMNAFVPQELKHTDVGYREWVPAVLAGMKQEYKIYKNLKGTAFVLYNFYNPDYKSPYGDRLNIRMGFEFVIKKKKQTQDK